MQLINQDASKPSEAAQTKPGLKTRAKEQIRDFALIFLYLWIVFGMMAIHKSIILWRHQINSVSHGLAVVNALVFAKVMLVAQDFNLGHRLHDKPLIYAVIFKSVLFAIAGAVRNAVGIWCGAFSGNMKVSFPAARSIG